MKEYEESLARGSALLNKGDTAGALDVFLSITKQLGAKPTSEVLQLTGICWRMCADYDRATAAFGRAYETAGNDVDKGRVMRDWALVPLAQRRYDDAMKCLDESLGLLSRQDVVEYAVTMGFIGRVHAKRGDKESARNYFRMADLTLKKPEVSKVYELNNLVHWMGVESLVGRFKLARRAWPLAYHAGNLKRQMQIILLVVCRPLATRYIGR